MLEIIKQFVRRMLMGKGKGILQIAPKKDVDKFAKELLKKFKANGIPDSAIKNQRDVKIIWNQITNKEAQIMRTNMDDLLKEIDAPLTSKKPAEVHPFTGFKPRIQQDVDGIVKNLKSMDPVDAMKEASSIIGRKNPSYKGPYKNLTDDEAQKILKETDDHIFQREKRIKEQMDDIKEIEGPEDMASGGRAGMFVGGPVLAKGAKWFLNSLKKNLTDLRANHPRFKGIPVEEQKMLMEGYETFIKQLEAGGEVPKEALEAISKNPQYYKTKKVTRSQDPDLAEVEELIDEKVFGHVRQELKDLETVGRKPNASGGIAGQLHLNRPGYGLGDLVKEKIPAEYRLYAKSILPGGESGKVGSDYFTEDFKQELRKQALYKYQQTGKLTGQVREHDQHRGVSSINKLTGFPSTYASLGTYTYDIDPKTLDVKITDRYDWNPEYGKLTSGDTENVGWIGDKRGGTDVDLTMLKDYVVNAVKNKEIDKASALELIGNYFGGKASEGKGFDVDIDIPTREATPATEGSFAKGGLAHVLGV